MDDNWNKEVVGSFLRVGIIVLTVIGVFALGVNYMPDGISVTTSSTKKLPIYCVDTEKPQIALSFDAAWGNENTQEILDCLEKYNVKASFFVTGNWVEQYEEDVKQIVESGHDVGNHSQNHKQMSALSKEECSSEITKVHTKVKALTGQDMTLFRAPYGDYNNTLLSTCNELNYYCIQWDIDSFDWKDYDALTVTNGILKNARLGKGSIILLHTGGKYTVEALPTIIEGLQAKGYELVPVSELMYKENYEMDSNGKQYSR